MQVAVCVGCGLLVAIPVVAVGCWLAALWLTGVVVGGSIVACQRMARYRGVS